MSISTGSICSFDSCSSSSWSSMAGKPTPPSKKVINDPSTHADTLRTAQLYGWRKEICNKVHVYPGDMASYLHTFVPSRTPCPLDAPDEVSSAEFKPVKGKEVKNYAPLTKILNDVVAEFPADRKPSFYGGHDQKLYFPFAEFAHKHHASKPDLAVSFPGRQLPKKIDQPDWSQFSMVIEAKDMSSKDPFALTGPLQSDDRADRLVQLAVSARSLMCAHGFLASFALGIYGDVVRIARFDHSCAIASPPVSIKSSEGLRAIQEFFWRFVHPWEGGPGAVVGADPTIRKLTENDTSWLVQRLGDEAGPLLDDVDVEEGRWVKVWDDDKHAEPRAFILFRLLDVNARLFSRSTMVWLGIEDTRFNNTAHPSGPETQDGEVQLRILKEAWRQVIRTPEQVFYNRLKATISTEERIGLPDLLYGGDLGARDVKRWEAAKAGETWPGGDDLLGATVDQHEQEDVPYPMHQTWSWRLLGLDKKFHANERSHMRFVLDTVGRPLSRFKSTKELVMAMRDAIIGHKLAMERGGVLHRDVSSGNILIVERAPSGRPPCHGILHDYDYSSMTLEPPRVGPTTADASELPPLHPLESLGENESEVADMKERTGTYYFISIHLLDIEADTVHCSAHDLESFFWVLVWIVLRHTNHQLGKDACGNVFKFGNDSDARLTKLGWVCDGKKSLKVANNAPLTELLAKFKKLTMAAVFDTEDVQTPLTYDPIIQIFDEAIRREDWPEHDPALPFTPFKPSSGSSVPSVIVGPALQPTRAKSKKKRSARIYEEDEDWLPGSEGAALVSGASVKTSNKRARRQGSSAMTDGTGASGSNVKSSASQASLGGPMTRNRARGGGSKTTSGRGKASRAKSGKGSGA